MIFKSIFFNGIEKLNDLQNLTRAFNNIALICAAKRGHKEIVEILLKQEGININSKNILNQKLS